MNIIEAIKSGKKFKRPHWPVFVVEAEMREPVDGYYEILPEDLIADDYEVEELKVTITRKQFDKAYTDTIVSLPHDATTVYIIDTMAKKLGLGD